MLRFPFADSRLTHSCKIDAVTKGHSQGRNTQVAPEVSNRFGSLCCVQNIFLIHVGLE